MVNRLLRHKATIPLLLLVISGIYYWALYSRDFTWIYTSGDAGDWLVQTNWWMVPHCWGKPLYISLVHLVSLIPGDPVAIVTICLSVIPGAIIVMMTYLIALKLTSDKRLSIIASLIVFGSNVMLSQATVVEQYSALAMIWLGAFYFYITGHKVWTIIFLGLMTASHMLGAVFTFMLLFVELSNWRQWAKLIPLYVVFGILPYGLILWMMADPNSPKLMAGGLSWAALNTYTGNTTSVAGLALVEGLNRTKETMWIMFSSMGLALVPLWRGFKKPWDNTTKFIIATSGFVMWFYFTNFFPSTWKFLLLAIPLLACVAVVGLKGLPKWHSQVVCIGAVVLIACNGFFFNTNQLNEENPLAREYMQALEALPDGSAVVTPRGGAYGFTLFWEMSKGKDLIPIALIRPQYWGEEVTDQSYLDYAAWLNEYYGIEGKNCYELVNDAMAKGHEIYFGQPMTKLWGRAFVHEDNPVGYLDKVIRVREHPPWDDLLAPLLESK